MVTLQDRIELSDGVSPAFSRMINAAAEVTSKFEQVGKAAEKMTSVGESVAANFAPEMHSVSAAAQAAAQSVDAVGTAANQMDIGSTIAAMTQSFGIMNVVLGEICQELVRFRLGIESAVKNVGLLVKAFNSIHAPPNIANTAKEGIAGFESLNVAATQSMQKIELVGDVAAVSAIKTTEISNAGKSISGRFDAAGSSVGGMNQKLTESHGILSGLKSALSSTFAQFTMANLAADAIQRIVSTVTQLPGRLAGLSDQYSSIIARLNLVTGSQEATVALNDQIYASALRARGGYVEMADAVSKIAMTAKEAFPDARQVVPFMEGIQKLFTIGGTDVVRQKDALLQLTQALGSGRLQGDEFRSIAEAAPMIEQMVARYMGVSQGALKELSSQGEITAEIMKNAILGNLDLINEQFDHMPKKWSDIWQNIETRGFRAFVPVFEQVSRLANTPIVQKFADGIVIGAQVASAAILGLMNNIEWLSNVVSDASSIISTVFEYIAGFATSALMIYGTAWAVANREILMNMALVAMQAVGNGILVASMAVKNAVMAIGTALTFAWTLATQGLTAAMATLNITMLTGAFMILGVVVFAIFAVIAAFGAWAIASHGLRNTIADVFECIVDVCEVGVNIMIKSINALLKVINAAATGMNNLFGTHFGQIEAVAEVNWQAKKTSMSEWIRNGSFSDLLPNLSQTLPIPEIPAIPGMDELAGSGKETADNTKAMKDAMEITDEDLKYLRDIAEQEVINKYTTAEVKIEMGGVHNNVSNDMDLDGVVRYMSDSIVDAMQAGAEAVHT